MSPRKVEAEDTCCLGPGLLEVGPWPGAARGRQAEGLLPAAEERGPPFRKGSEFRDERYRTGFTRLPGMILSGPFLEVISVNSLRILAAFFASDFKLEGIGLFTEIKKKS